MVCRHVLRYIVVLLPMLFCGCMHAPASAPEPAECQLGTRTDPEFLGEATALRRAEIKQIVDALRRDIGYPRPILVREAPGGLFRGVRCASFSLLLIAARSTSIKLDRDQSALERTLCEIVWPGHGHACLLFLARTRGETDRVRWLLRTAPRPPEEQVHDPSHRYPLPYPGHASRATAASVS